MLSRKGDQRPSVIAMSAFLTESLLSGDRFLDIFLRASVIAFGTRLEEKWELLADVVIGAVVE